jgi:hypothetical protein
MVPVSQLSTLAQYSAGMGLLYQILDPSIRKSQDEILNSFEAKNKLDWRPEFIYGFSRRVEKIRQIASICSFISMLFSIGILIRLTIDPTSCAFVFEGLCNLQTDSSLRAEWFVMISLIVGPIAAVLACFGAQMVLNRMIVLSVRSAPSQ